MTSIEMLSDQQISVDNFAAKMRSRFAEVFGYDDSVTVEPAKLWSLVASQPTSPEELHRNA